MEAASRTTNIVLIVVAFFLMVKVWPKIKAFVTLWRARHVPDRYALATVAPDHPIGILLEAGAVDIWELGFEQAFSFDLEAKDVLIRIDCYSKIDEPGTSALVKAPLIPASRPYDLHLQTRFQSGNGDEILVESIGGGALLHTREELPHAEYFGSILATQLLNEHQRRVAEYEANGYQRIHQHSGPESVEQRQRDQEEEIREGVDSGDIILFKDGSFRYSARATLAAINNFQRSSVAPTRGLYPLESSTPGDVCAMQVEAARCSVARKAGEHQEQPGYLILLALSFVGFFLGIWAWLGMKAAVTLSIIILFHELGHLVGMKICGYRNARILFVPMFGGVAMGRKSNPTPFQELIVLLLGPVPGIVVGLGCMLVSLDSGKDPKWLFEFGWMTVFINYLNLLPVMPLDGGRILSALFMRRVPRLQFVFSIISTLAFCVAAFYLGSVLLWVLAGFGLLRIRSLWLAGTITKKTIGRLADTTSDPEEITLAVIQAMRSSMPPEKIPPLPVRFTIVNQIVASLRQTKATVPMMIFGSCLYVACLLVPVYAAIIWATSF